MENHSLLSSVNDYDTEALMSYGMKIERFIVFAFCAKEIELIHPYHVWFVGLFDINYKSTLLKLHVIKYCHIIRECSLN